MKTIEEIVIDVLEPTFKDMMLSNNGVNYWVSYGAKLQVLGMSEFDDYFIRDLNIGMNSALSSVKDACVDVASTLESLAPEKYAGQFKY